MTPQPPMADFAGAQVSPMSRRRFLHRQCIAAVREVRPDNVDATTVRPLELINLDWNQRSPRLTFEHPRDLTGAAGSPDPLRRGLRKEHEWLKDRGDGVQRHGRSYP